MVEEELGAFLDQFAGQHTGSGCEVRSRRSIWPAVDATVDLGGQARLSLCLSQLANDLCARALGALLLRDGIVGAGQLGRGAVAARVDAVALDLSPVTGVAGSLYGLSHGGRQTRRRRQDEARRFREQE